MRRVGLTPRSDVRHASQLVVDPQWSRFESQRQAVKHVGHSARVPGIGLLNRTYKRRAERHEVQLLRGLPLQG